MCVHKPVSFISCDIGWLVLLLPQFIFADVGCIARKDRMMQRWLGRKNCGGRGSVVEFFLQGVAEKYRQIRSCPGSILIYRRLM